MDETCKAKVVVMVRRDGTPVEQDCGKWWAGERQYCPTCLERHFEDYPQGWRGYPGDTCRHGTYVGGCGVDHICGPCEVGYG